MCSSAEKSAENRIRILHFAAKYDILYDIMKLKWGNLYENEKKEAW